MALALQRQHLSLVLGALATWRDQRSPVPMTPARGAHPAVPGRRRDSGGGQRSPAAGGAALAAAADQPGDWVEPAAPTLGRWQAAPLVSRGWKRRLRSSRTISPLSAQHEAPALRNLSSRAASPIWSGAPCAERTPRAAPEVVRPTTVQSKLPFPPYFAAATSSAARRAGDGRSRAASASTAPGQPSLDASRI